MLKLVKRRGSPHLYLRGTVRGISIFESTGVGLSNRKAAQEIKARRETELLEESIHGRRAVATFYQAARSYIEASGESRFIEPIILHFGATKLSMIGQGEIDAAARTIYPKQAPSTLNRQAYTPISAVLRHASKRGWCTAFVIERLQEDPPPYRWLTYDEAQRLIAACSPHMRPLVIFLLYTGARIGEALWLDWRDVSLDRSHVQFIDTKNGTSRGVPMHHRAVEALRPLYERDIQFMRKRNVPDIGEGMVVFRKPDGTIYRPLDDDDPNDVSAGCRIKTGFQGAVRRAGLTDFTPHGCRHTWATWHYQANRDLGALQKLGGWATLSMVLRYAHTNVAELDQTIERLR